MLIPFSAPMAASVLQSILGDTPLCNVFEEFLARTCAWENFAFYYEVEQYKRSSYEDRISTAHEIYEKFLRADAPFELGDVNRTSRESIEARLHTGESTLFDVLQRVSFKNLACSSVSDFFEDQLFFTYRDNLFHAPEAVEREFSPSPWLPSCLSA